MKKFFILLIIALTLSSCGDTSQIKISYNDENIPVYISEIPKEEVNTQAGHLLDMNSRDNKDWFELSDTVEALYGDREINDLVYIPLGDSFKTTLSSVKNETILYQMEGIYYWDSAEGSGLTNINPPSVTETEVGKTFYSTVNLAINLSSGELRQPGETARVVIGVFEESDRYYRYIFFYRTDGVSSQKS